MLNCGFYWKCINYHKSFSIYQILLKGLGKFKATRGLAKMKFMYILGIIKFTFISVFKLQLYDTITLSSQRHYN